MKIKFNFRLMVFILTLFTMFSGVAFSQNCTSWYANEGYTDVDGIKAFSIGQEDMWKLACVATLVNNSGQNGMFNGERIKLTEDIDLSGVDWTPIGVFDYTEKNQRPFRGEFDGGNHVIRKLKIDNKKTYQGLFGYIKGGTVKDLAVVDVDISADSYIGAVAAQIDGSSGIIKNCFVTGKISGGSNTGGIAGYSAVTVENCYTDVTITTTAKSGTAWGGIVGRNGGIVKLCYAIGSVTGYGRVGGVIGSFDSNTPGENAIDVVALNPHIKGNSNGGRLVGYNYGNSGMSGLAAWGEMEVMNAKIAGGLGNDKNGSPLSVDNINAGMPWVNFNKGTDFWTIRENRPPILKSFSEDIQISKYPEHLFKEQTEVPQEEKWYYDNDGTTPFYISDAAELAFFAKLVNGGTNFDGKAVKLTQDIDFEQVDLSGQIEDYLTKGWIPIGNGTNISGSLFKGIFDGQGHILRNLNVNRPDVWSVGLFGAVQGTVKNLGLINPSVNGGEAVGGVAGWFAAGGVIENCFVFGGDVIGHNSGSGGSINAVGGVVGSAKIARNLYSSAKVTGNSFVGGVVGDGTTGSQKNLYSTGNVSGGTMSGGIVGTVDNATVENSVALNKSIPSSYTGRIVYNKNGVSTNNYAWDGVLVGNSSVSSDVASTTAKSSAIHGADVTADEIWSGAVWGTGYADFPESDWIIEEGKLPILRVFEEDENGNPRRGGVRVQDGEIPSHIPKPVTSEVTSVTVSPATASVEKGMTHQFTVIVDVVGGASQAVTWTVADNISTGTTIVDGLLTVAADETATTLTVTAMSDFDNTKSGTATVTVTAPVIVDAEAPTIDVQPVAATYTVGETATALSVTAIITDGGTLSYEWFSNEDNSTTGGTVVGTNANTYTPSTDVVGTLYYYVVVTNTNTTVNGTQTATATSDVVSVVVNAALTPTVTSVTVDPATIDVQKGETQQFSVVVGVLGGASEAVTWSVSGDVTISTGTTIVDGLLTVATDETATTLTVTATSDFDDTKFATATVTVKDVPVTQTTYTVTFVDYDGTTVLKAETVNEGGTATAPANPSRVGYTFTGWDKTFANVTGNLTVTAQYTIKTYTVTFSVNGGSAVTQQTIAHGGTVAEPTVPTRSNYVFNGWYKESALATPWNFTVDEVTAATTIYAQWLAGTVHDITLTPGSGAPVTATLISGTLTIRGNGTMKDFAGLNKARASAADVNAPWRGTSVTKVIIEADVTNIGANAFAGCTALKTIVALGVTPPTGLNADAFGGTAIPTGVCLYVPAGSVPAYKTAGWDGCINPLASAPTITFNANGGSVSQTTATTTSTMRLASLPTPTRSGSYSFDGWFTAASGGEQVRVGPNGTVFTENATVIARWTYIGGSVYTPPSTSRPGTTSTMESERVVPNTKPNEEVSVITPVIQLSGDFTVGPNPVGRELGSVSFFRQGKRVANTELRIYDATGNVVGKVKITDNALGNHARRKVGSWDLRDKSGRLVSEGTYLVKGKVTTTDGKSEKVSVIVGVR